MNIDLTSTPDEHSSVSSIANSLSKKKHSFAPLLNGMTHTPRSLGTRLFFYVPLTKKLKLRASSPS
jgi:hypothetical protein